MVKTRCTNTHQGRALAALRDALLPKLISGELRIADAKPMIEAQARSTA